MLLAKNRRNRLACICRAVGGNSPPDRDTIDSYKDAVPDSEEGRLIRQLEDIYSQLQETFAEGVYDAGETFRQTENTTGEGGVRYKTSNEKYWYPNMTKSEIAEIKSIAKNEAKKTDNYLGIGAKWLYNKKRATNSLRYTVTSILKHRRCCMPAKMIKLPCIIIF